MLTKKILSDRVKTAHEINPFEDKKEIEDFVYLEYGEQISDFLQKNDLELDELLDDLSKVCDI